MSSDSELNQLEISENRRFAHTYLSHFLARKISHAGFGDDDTFRRLSISSCLDWLAMATAKVITPFVVGACYAIRGVFEISTAALMQLVRYVAT